LSSANCQVVRNQPGVASPSNGHPPSGPRAAPDADPVPWHTLPADVVVERLGVVPALGLSSAEAGARLARHGANRFPSPEPKSGLAILVDQVASLPVALLAGAAGVSLLSGALFDAVVILGVRALGRRVARAR